MTCFLLLLVAATAAEGLAQSKSEPPGYGPLTEEEMRADLQVFRSSFFAVDRAYAALARAEAEARLAELETALGTLTRAQFELRLAQIVALADNGHTLSFAGHRSDHFNRVPIRLTPFGEDFYVLRAKQPYAALLGARLVAVDGSALEDLREAARTLTGGLPAWRDRFANFLVESPEQLFALGLIPAPEGARYVFMTPEGKRVTRPLVGEEPEVQRPAAGPAWSGGPRRFLFPDAKRWMYPKSLSEEAETWQTALSPADAPWSLHAPEEVFRASDLPALDATVIEMRKNTDAPGYPIKHALKDFEARIKQHGRSHLVVDMRANGGGDLTSTRDFMERLPALVPGEIFVLISPWTFSAAISSIGYLKQAAPNRVTLIGEGPGDRLEFFAEGRVVHLPHADLMLLYATERHDYFTGCQGKTDCHGNVARHPIAVPSLTPDIAAPWTFAAYADRRDPGMEAVASFLANR